MYKRIALALYFATAIPVAADYRHFEVLEHAAEVMELRLSPNLQQLVYAKRCDACPTLALSIDKSTLIYDGRTLIPVASAARFENRGGTIFFDPTTRRVNRIVYWKTTQQKS